MRRWHSDRTDPPSWSISIPSPPPFPAPFRPSRPLLNWEITTHPNPEMSAPVIWCISQTKQLWSRRRSDQTMNYIWWLWLQENSEDHHLLNYLPVSWIKCYITDLLPKRDGGLGKKTKNKSTPPLAVVPTRSAWKTSRAGGNLPASARRLRLPPSTVIWMALKSATFFFDYFILAGGDQAEEVRNVSVFKGPRCSQSCGSLLKF